MSEHLDHVQENGDRSVDTPKSWVPNAESARKEIERRRIAASRAATGLSLKDAIKAFPFLAQYAGIVAVAAACAQGGSEGGNGHVAEIRVHSLGPDTPEHTGKGLLKTGMDLIKGHVISAGGHSSDTKKNGSIGGSARRSR